METPALASPRPLIMEDDELEPFDRENPLICNLLNRDDDARAIALQEFVAYFTEVPYQPDHRLTKRQTDMEQRQGHIYIDSGALRAALEHPCSAPCCHAMSIDSTRVQRAQGYKGLPQPRGRVQG